MSETTAERSTALEVPERAATSLAPVEAMDDAAINRAWRVAKALAVSGIFKDVKQAEQAFAKILIGADLGLSPTEAMSNIAIVEGKPELSANFHAMRVKQSPHHDYAVSVITDEECTIDFYEDGELCGTSTFTMEDARRAHLDKRSRIKDAQGKGKEGTSIYEKFPRNMLFARAMSNGVAWFCPQVMGSIRVYTPGEVAELAEAETEAVREAEVADSFDWSQIDDEEVRERLHAAVSRLEALEPDTWTPARCEMEFVGRSTAQLKALAEKIEQRCEERERTRTELDEEADALPPQDKEGAVRDLLAAKEVAAQRLERAQSDVEEADARAQLQEIQRELDELGAGEHPAA